MVVKFFSQQTVLSLLIMMLVTDSIYAQQTDSLKTEQDTLIANKVMSQIANKFPMTRLVNVEFRQIAPHDFTAKYLGQDLPDGKVHSLYQLRAGTNVNFLKTKKWMLGGSFNYHYISMEAEGTNIFSGSNAIGRYKEDFHFHNTTLSVTRFTTLFKKTAVFSGSVNINGSEQHFERLTGLITGTLVLKANAQTKMTIGIVGLIDPNMIVPAFLSFSYEHKFKNDWMIDIILPKQVYVRKHVFKNGRFSVGNELDNTSFYIYNDNKKYSFSQLEINSGLVYEHYLGKSFVATLKSGARYVPLSRISHKNESVNDYISSSKPDLGFYFNVGISFNPF